MAIGGRVRAGRHVGTIHGAHDGDKLFVRLHDFVMALLCHGHQLFPGALKDRPLVLRLVIEAAGIDDFSQARGGIAHMRALSLRQHTQLEKHGRIPFVVFLFI